MVGEPGVRAPVESLLARGRPAPPAAAYGARTYFADLHAPRGARHVRVCSGTACFVASGGGHHVPGAEAALGVPAGSRSPDGSVSVQEVHCLGYCYAAPAALDDDQVRAGPDVVDQLAGHAAGKDPPVPVRAVAEPVVLAGVVGGAPAWRVWPRVRAGAGGADLVRREVSRSGLRGRGGAGFPVARKWAAVAASHGAAYVVANGDEGDPGSFADRLLMEQDPDRVLEGLALAALACGASRGVVFVRSEYPRARAAMERAVVEARRAGHLGEGFDVEVVTGHGSYVAGEETSLLRAAVGLRGTVRPRPPYPTEHGLLGHPTAVNNVETLAAVPWIVERGGDLYARLGAADETGTMLVCLNERFTAPGVLEVELGTPVRRIVEELGGGLREDRPLRAVQVGGPLGGFLGPDGLDVPLLASALRRVGVALGHGSVVAVDDRVDAAALVAHLWRFAADESCGACTPCREGTRRGAADPREVSDRLLDLMEHGSLCAFGRSLPTAVRSLEAIAW